MRISLFAFVLAGCKSDLYEGVSRPSELALPSRADFKRVADAMQLHCGTLDCHGQIGRNMRLYGHYGLRLDPKDNPLEAPTSSAEYDASYWSLVGLEPEALSRVVTHGTALDSLTLIRKPRGIEEHKGGKLISDGDSLDRCIAGWLIGPFEAESCNAVTQMQRPELDGGR
jgi:hypothetical protein